MRTLVRDLWNSSGPGVLAWSYEDDHPECETVYTVYVAHPGGRPRIQFKLHTSEGVRYTSVDIENPERFGEWNTPRKFAQWARRWKDAGDAKPLTA